MAEAKERKRYKHLSYEERIIIGQKRKEGSPLAEIGRLLGRAAPRSAARYGVTSSLPAPGIGMRSTPR